MDQIFGGMASEQSQVLQERNSTRAGFASSMIVPSIQSMYLNLRIGVAICSVSPSNRILGQGRPSETSQSQYITFVFTYSVIHSGILEKLYRLM